MYRCDQCHEQTAPREKAYKLVIETRTKTYDDWRRGGRVGHGFETAKEIMICPRCLGKGENI